MGVTIAPTAVWTWDTNMTLRCLTAFHGYRTIGISTYPGCSNTMDPDMVCMSPWHCVTAQVTHTWIPSCHRIPIWTHVEDLTLDILMGQDGNRSHTHQSRPCSVYNHEPRHSPWQQPGPRWHHGTRWQHRPFVSVWPLLWCAFQSSIKSRLC